MAEDDAEQEVSHACDAIGNGQERCGCAKASKGCIPDRCIARVFLTWGLGSFPSVRRWCLSASGL